MKLIQQTVLLYRLGSSEKVFEVDLCEVGPAKFVVNYRYGRRGAPLKDGSKTPLPVSESEARAAFAAFVHDKEEQGYELTHDLTPQAIPLTPRAAPPPAPPAPAPLPPSMSGPAPAPAPSLVSSGDPRAQRILFRLQQGDTSPATMPARERLIDRARNVIRGPVRRPGPRRREWSLDRVIWRAGDLRLREANPFLRRLLNTGTPLREYAIVRALILSGDSSVVPDLESLLAASATSEAVRRLALEGLRTLLEPARRQRFLQDRLAELPYALQDALRTGDATQLVQALTRQLETRDPKAYACVDTLALLEGEPVRTALKYFIREAPLRPPAFQRLRHLLKLMELRRDGELFGLIAWRLEKKRAMYQRRRWGAWVLTDDGNRLRADRNGVASPNAQLAYSDRTRRYLRRRVWRTLRRLGELGDPDYVKLAVGVLLPFSDADAEPIRTTQSGWGRNARTTRFDAFASYWAFNHILFHASPRYEPSRPHLSFRCRSAYQPGQPAPRQREEAFPGLWNQAPAGLLMLLDASSCRPVHEFAVRALRSLPALLDALEREAILMLLSRPYEVTAELGFELFHRRFTPLRLDWELLVAAAHCAHAPGRQETRRLIEQARSDLAAEPRALGALLTGPFADTRAWARALLSALFLPAQQARPLCARLLSLLLSLPEDQSSLAGDLCQTLTTVFAPYLQDLGQDVLQDLLRHPLVQVQELAAELVLSQTSLVNDPPAALLEAMLTSSHPTVRLQAFRLLSMLSETALAARGPLILQLASHPSEELRQGVHPLLLQLARQGHKQSSELAMALLGKALEPTTPPDVVTSLAKFLETGLLTLIPALPKDLLFRMISSRSQAIQSLGAHLLPFALSSDALEVKDLLLLANHELQGVRATAWVLIEASLPMLRSHIPEVIALLDSTWDDTRTFAMSLFLQERYFDTEDFTPETLVAICDSPLVDVQELGRKLLYRHFQRECGWQYLAALSEHPAPGVQLMATQLLEGYAAGEPERIQRLEPYFLTVLTQVNRGKLARDRILRFLEEEALKQEAVARLVMPWLERVSAVMAIGLRASLVELLFRLGDRYPALPSPLRVVSPEVRHGI